MLQVTSCDVSQLHVLVPFLAARIPRYARVNLLKTTVCKVLSVLSEEGYVLVEKEEWLCHFTSCGILKEVQYALTDSTIEKPSDENHQRRGMHKYYHDEHLSDVLVFCTCAPLTKSVLYHHSEIVLQDKVEFHLTTHINCFTLIDSAKTTCRHPVSQRISLILPLEVV